MRRVVLYAVVALCGAFDVLAGIVALVGPRGYAACGLTWLTAMVLAIVLGTLGIPLVLGAAGGIALARRGDGWGRVTPWIASALATGTLTLGLLATHALAGVGGTPVTCSP